MESLGRSLHPELMKVLDSVPRGERSEVRGSRGKGAPPAIHHEQRPSILPARTAVFAVSSDLIL